MTKPVTIRVPLFRCTDVGAYDVDFLEFGLKGKQPKVIEKVHAWRKDTGAAETLSVVATLKTVALILRDEMSKVDKLLDLSKYLVLFPSTDREFDEGSDEHDIETVKQVQRELRNAGIDLLTVQELLENRRQLSHACRIFERETGMRVVDGLAAAFNAYHRSTLRDLKEDNGVWEKEDLFDFAIKVYNDAEWSDMMAMPDAARHEDETQKIATKAVYLHASRQYFQN